MREYPSIPRTYELMTILSPEVPEEEIAPSLETIAGYIRNENGVLFEVLRDAPWGRRRLAYPIRYHGRDVRDGYYTVFHFEATPESIAEIDRELKLNDRIMRHILVKYERSENEPRPEEIREGDLLRSAAPAPAPEGAAPAAEESAPAAEGNAPTAEESAGSEAPATTDSTEPPVTPPAPSETSPVQETTTLNEPSENAPAETAPADENAAPGGNDAAETTPEESKEG